MFKFGIMGYTTKRKRLFNIQDLLLITACFTIINQDLSAQQVIPAKIVSREITTETPPFYGSIYVQTGGAKMRSGDLVSEDNGKSWTKNRMMPDFSAGLPAGYRRSEVTSVLDPFTRRMVTIVNSLDVKDLDPGIHEPPVAQKTYYLRYRVSDDAGKTWRFDDPVIQSGAFNSQHPFPGIYIGKNSIYLGDRGSIPVVTRKGKILVPAQTTILGKDGELWNPGNGHTYTDVVVLIGTWTKEGKLSWEMSERVEGDPERSTRGMIEPTLTELNDGRLVMIMRGSNASRGSSEYVLPSHKWISVSKNGGKSWTKPEPLEFENGKTLYSPSSMSALFKHSSGRYFWVGNMTEKNSEGNLPRWPLVFAELNPKTLKLIPSGILTVDTQKEEDKSRGRLDISHFSLLEDRQTKEIILTYPRSYDAYKSREWVTARIRIEDR